MRLQALLSLSACLLSGGFFLLADEGQKALEQEQKHFEGSWELVKEEVNGKLRADVTGERLVVEDEEIRFISAGSRERARASFVLHPERAPRQIDVEFTQGPLLGKKQLGIYRFIGDRLEIALGGLDSEKRPRRFSGQLVAGAGKVYAVYCREKDE